MPREVAPRRPLRARSGRLVRGGWVAAWLLASPLALLGCDDPIETVDAGPDAGPEDAEPGPDAEIRDSGPADAEPMDAEPTDAEPMDAGSRRKVSAGGLTPAVGTTGNAARTVRGLIPSPTGGESSNTERKVRGLVGAPRPGS